MDYIPGIDMPHMILRLHDGTLAVIIYNMFQGQCIYTVVSGGSEVEPETAISDLYNYGLLRSRKYEFVEIKTQYAHAQMSSSRPSAISHALAGDGTKLQIRTKLVDECDESVLRYFDDYIKIARDYLAIEMSKQNSQIRFLKAADPELTLKRVSYQNPEFPQTGPETGDVAYILSGRIVVYADMRPICGLEPCPIPNIIDAIHGQEEEAIAWSRKDGEGTLKDFFFLQIAPFVKSKKMSQRNLQAIGIWPFPSWDGIKCHCEIFAVRKEIRNLFEKYFKQELKALEKDKMRQ